jgi:hypothetical protein
MLYKSLNGDRAVVPVHAIFAVRLRPVINKPLQADRLTKGTYVCICGSMRTISLRRSTMPVGKALSICVVKEKRAHDTYLEGRTG